VPLKLWNNFREFSMNESEELLSRRDALQKRRDQFLEQIAQAANEIKRIDERLAILKSIQLENKLIEAEDCHV
jgi:hypothetical protein